MERYRRRRRIPPNLDAEQHIKQETDKAGLTEHFINPYKGLFLNFCMVNMSHETMFLQFQIE